MVTIWIRVSRTAGGRFFQSAAFSASRGTLRAAAVGRGVERIDVDVSNHV